MRICAFGIKSDKSCDLSSKIPLWPKDGPNLADFTVFDEEKLDKEGKLAMKNGLMPLNDGKWCFIGLQADF